MSTHVDAPAPRNIAQETGETLQTQIALAPQQLAAYQQTAPAYAQTDLSILGQSLFGEGFQGNLSDINRRLTDEAAVQSREANTAQRQADLADVAQYGGQVQAIQRGANQELFGNLDALDAAAANAGVPGAAGSAFLSAAQTNSNSPLTFGEYSPETVRSDFSPQAVTTTYAPGQAAEPSDIVAERVSNAQTDPQNASAIEAALERQALDELNLGDSLSADEARQVRVQSRAAADARGRGFSNAALADEVLNSANARRARLDSRRTFAAGANELLRTGQAADRGYALARDQFRAGIDTSNANLGLEAQRINAANRLTVADLNTRDRQFAASLGAENQRFNSGMGLSAAQLAAENARYNSGIGLSAAQLNSANRLAAAQFGAGRTDADRAALAQAAGFEQGLASDAFGRRMSATQARLATFTDPFQGVLGRGSSNAGSNAQLFGNAVGTAGASAGTTRAMFDPFNAYAADMYNTNYNAQAAANIATANNRASMIGAGIGAIGMLGAGALAGPLFGGAAAACWVARAVYGESSDRWPLFRRWLLTRAPLTLLARYLACGRAAAVRVREEPAYRAEMRKLMDAVLNLQTA